MASEPDFYRLKVVHGKFVHEITVPNRATFGDVKHSLEGETFLKPDEQIILFRGKAFPDDEKIQMAGITNRTKLNLEENTALIEKRKRDSFKEIESNDSTFNQEHIPQITPKVSDNLQKSQKLENPFLISQGSVSSPKCYSPRNGYSSPRKDSPPEKASSSPRVSTPTNVAAQNLYFSENGSFQPSGLSKLSSKTMNEINSIRNEVDQYSVQVREFEAKYERNNVFEKKSYLYLNEILERLVLKLDCLEVNGEERMERKNLVRRIQSLNSDLDKIKLISEDREAMQSRF